jgi:hypothetical protein
MTRPIGFAGLIAARRQAEPWSNRLYFCEPSRVVNRVTEGERYDSADAWRRHEHLCHRIGSRGINQLTIKLLELGEQGLAHLEQRPGDKL